LLKIPSSNNPERGWGIKGEDYKLAKNYSEEVD